MLTTVWRIFLYMCEVYSYYRMLVLVGEGAGKLYEIIVDAYHDRNNRRLKKWVKRNFSGEEREEVMEFLEAVWWID